MDRATIDVTRQFAFNDLARSYNVMVDGEKRDSVGVNETEQIEVEPGTHRVWLKVDWCRSPIAEIEVEPGESSQIVCRGSNLLPGLAAVTLPAAGFGYFGMGSPIITIVAFAIFVAATTFMLTAMRSRYIVMVQPPHGEIVN